MIKAHAARGEAAEAKGVIVRMRADGIEPTQTAFTTLMAMHARAGERVAMLSQFQAMEKAGLRPTTASWNVVLDYCARKRQPAQAEGVLRRMIAVGTPPDAVSYGSLIKAHVSAGNLDEARTRVWRGQTKRTTD